MTKKINNLRALGSPTNQWNDGSLEFFDGETRRTGLFWLTEVLGAKKTKQ